MTTPNSDITATSDTAPQRLGRRLATTAAAMAGAVLVWLLAVPVAGIDLLVRPGQGAEQHVGLASVVIVSLLAALLGWGLLAVLERLWPRRARTIWTTVALVVLLLSLAGPLTAASSPAVAAVLAVMHLVVGAVLIPGLPRNPRRTA